MRTLSEGPTTADEFAQSLIEDGIDHWLLDTAPEAAEVPDTVAEQAEQPRDEHGRFMSTSIADDDEGESDEEEPEAPAQEAVTAEEEAPSDEPEEDEDTGELEFELEPDVLAVLEKYDGDLNKALKALSEGQSLIGRQGNELGELRSQMVELTNLVQQNQFNPMMFAPYQNDPEENPQGLVQEVLERTAQTGQFDEVTYERAIALWGEEDPFGAARMDARVAFVRQMVDNAAAQQGAPDAPQAVSDEPDVETAMAAVVQRHPDVEQYLPAVGELAKQFPTLRDAMQNGDPSQKAQAFEELLVVAKSRSLADTSREAMKRVVLKTQEEVRKEKADAAVVSAGRQTAATGASTGLDAFYAAFDRATGQSEED